MTDPFLKWAGGKRALLPELLRCVPKTYRRYYEPFLGSGALLFMLDHPYSVGNDSNEDLIYTYRILAWQPEDVIDRLRWHQEHHNKEYYYTIRSQHTGLTNAELAARFIYLNKTCFNGLWRVNAKGEFNVPMGSYVNPTICDERRLLAASAFMQRIKMQTMCTDYKIGTMTAGPNDFIYLDPPYYTEQGFTSYTTGSFGEREHRELAEWYAVLSKRGCKVLLSNSDTPLTRELYKDYCVETVYAPRAINSKASGRGKVAELLVRNYEVEHAY